MVEVYIYNENVWIFKIVPKIMRNEWFYHLLQTVNFIMYLRPEQLKQAPK